MAVLKGVKTLDMVDGEITKVAYEGTEYEKTNSPVEAGDLFLLKEGHFIGGAEVGAFYTTKKYEDGDIVIPTASIGNASYTQSIGKGVAFRKKYTRLKVGDYAKVVDDSGHDAVTKGDFVKITEDDATALPFKCDVVIGKSAGGYIWAREHELVLATEAEVAEAKAPKFSVGDYAKVVGDTYHSDIVEGAIVKITDLGDGEGDLRFELVGDDDYDYAKPSSLEKVSAEEAKWAEIGRKVDEYHKGDIVQFKDDYVAIGVVEDVGVCLLAVRMPDEAYQSPYKNNVTLIAPIEARFDRS